MQICEYFFENACYSVTKYYLCKQNNKRSLLGRKQRHQVVRSFPNRYLFSLTNKLTFLFPISCILDIILHCKRTYSGLRNNFFGFPTSFSPSLKPSFQRICPTCRFGQYLPPCRPSPLHIQVFSGRYASVHPILGRYHVYLLLLPRR